MRKRKHEPGLSLADIERSEGALRILNAYAAFGLSLMRNEIPTRPALSQQAQRAKLDGAAFKQ
jgi:hypothetical protein